MNKIKQNNHSSDLDLSNNDSGDLSPKDAPGESHYNEDSGNVPPEYLESHGYKNEENFLLQMIGRSKKTQPRKGGENAVAKFFLFFLPAVLIIFFILFVWPTMYQYSTLKQGNRIYLVRANRLTDSKSYFYGGKWLNAPLPAAQPLRLPDPLSVTSPNDKPLPHEDYIIKEPTELAGKPISMPPQQTRTEAPEVKASTVSSAPDQKKAKDEKPSAATTRQAKRTATEEKTSAGTHPRAKTEGKSEVAGSIAGKPDIESRNKDIPTKRKPYAIQIGAFPSKDEMNTFLEDQGDKSGIYWVKVKINNKVWYRTFIGQFAKQSEARDYIQGKKVGAQYPGSFVQKLP